MPGKLDWFPFYTRDFFGSRKVKRMTNELIGMYIKMLTYQWEDGPISKENEEICEIIGVQTRKGLRLIPVLLENFEERSEGYVNLFLEKVAIEQEAKTAKASEDGRIAANIRWERERAERNATAMQPHSEPNAIRGEERREEKKEEELTPDGGTPELEDNIIESKKTKQPQTPNYDEDIWQEQYWDGYLEKGVDVGAEIFKMTQWVTANSAKKKNWRRFIVNWLNRSVTEAIPPSEKSAHVPPMVTERLREVSKEERTGQVQAIGNIMKEHWPDEEVEDESQG